MFTLFSLLFLTALWLNAYLRLLYFVNVALALLLARGPSATRLVAFTPFRHAGHAGVVRQGAAASAEAAAPQAPPGPLARHGRNPTESHALTRRTRGTVVAFPLAVRGRTAAGGEENSSSGRSPARRTGCEAQEIVRAAADEHVGMIVMGAHGRTGLDRLLLGSVTERVVRTAACPVLTVRPDHPEPEV
jgi:nucleotide-binding universal stress UspA family protein